MSRRIQPVPKDGVGKLKSADIGLCAVDASEWLAALIAAELQQVAAAADRGAARQQRMGPGEDGERDLAHPKGRQQGTGQTGILELMRAFPGSESRHRPIIRIRCRK